MNEEEFISEFYSCDNEEEALKRLYSKLCCLKQENQELKEQLEECQLQNFNLREDIMIKKMSFPSKEIKDKSFLELYDMPSYEDLKNESEQLKEKLQANKKARKEAIEYINVTEYSDIVGLNKNGIKEFWFVKDILKILDIDKGE